MFSADRFHPSSAGYAFLGTIYGRAVRDAILGGSGGSELSAHGSETTAVLRPAADAGTAS
jgi:hypothetical protein